MAAPSLTCPHCACALDGSGPVDTAPARTEAASEPGVTLSLLGGFDLTADGSTVPLQPGARRVVAYTALQHRPVPRSVVAGTLWPDTTDGRAAASLRSALWRLGGADGPLVCTDRGALSLAPAVAVDVSRLAARAETLLTDGEDTNGTAGPADAPAAAGGVTDTTMFEAELLPGWCDEWVIAERERLRILQLAALERIGRRLIEQRRPTRALEVCLRLTLAEPLRETAHRLIIRAHLSQGNRAEAIRHYQRFRDLLWRELRVRPSPQMERLVGAATTGTADGAEPAAAW